MRERGRGLYDATSVADLVESLTITDGVIQRAINQTLRLYTYMSDVAGVREASAICHETLCVCTRAY